MRTLVLPLLFVLLVSQALVAQIKVGDNPQNLDPASVLELESTDRVLVITRITTAQMNAIVPQPGAMVYNTDMDCIYYFDGTAWANLCETIGVTLSAEAVVNDTPTIEITQTGDNYNLEVAPSSIQSEHIVNGGVNGIDIQNNSIGPGKLAPTSVTRDKLSENAVGVFQLATDEIDLALFENGTGFIRDNEVVSDEPDNAITNNGGAFYDDSTLQASVAANTQAIADDGDTDSGNEIQDLTLAGNTLSLTQSGQTIDLGGFSDSGSDDQNLTGATLGAGNILQIDIENGASATVDLSPLTSAGEIDDNELITNAVLNGTDLVITEAGTDHTVPLGGLGGGGTTDGVVSNVELLSGSDLVFTGSGGGFNGTIDLSSISGGSDGVVSNVTLTGSDLIFTGSGGGFNNTVDLSLLDDEADGTTILGTGTNADPFRINPGPNGQYLSTSGGVVTWANLPGGTGGTVETDGVTLEGNGVTPDVLQVRDGGITTVKIAAEGNDGEVLTTDGTTVSWGPIPQISADNVTLDSSDVGFPYIFVQDGIDQLYLDISGHIASDDDTSITNEIQTITSPDASVTVTSVGNNYELAVAGGGTDDQGLVLTGDVLSIEDGTGTVDLSTYVDDADADPANEIQTITSPDASVTVTSVGNNYELAVTGGGNITSGDLTVGGATNALLGNITLEIQAGVIENGDISATAAIDGSKINPDFGTQDISGENLTVAGSIFRGATDLHPDYVFQKYFIGHSNLNDSYQFKTLTEIEAFIKKYHHLPGIKSAAQVKNDGYWNLSASNLQNLEKIEELFLHTIEQEKKIKSLQSQNKTMAKDLEALKKEFGEIKALLNKE